MRVGQEYAAPLPPWTPDVWRLGPDALVAQARATLFQNQHDIDGSLDTAAGGGYPDAMSGPVQAPANESEEYVSTPPGGRESTKSAWTSTLDEIMNTHEAITNLKMNPAPN